MGSRRGYTRRGLLGSGAAGAAALGPRRLRRRLLRAVDRARLRRPQHRADRHRQHAGGLHRRLQPRPPQPDAQPRRAGAATRSPSRWRCRRRCPRARRVARCSPACARSRTATGCRPRACRPSPAGSRSPTTSRSSPRCWARRASRPPTAPTTRSWSARGSRTSGARSTGRGRATRRAPTASSTSPSSARRRAARSSATCFPSSPTRSRSGGCARWSAGTASTATARATTRPRASSAAAINLVDDLKRKRPFFLGVDAFDPHEPLDAPRVLRAPVRRAEGDRARGDHPGAAVRDALLVGRSRSTWTTRRSSACASCTPPRSPSSTSGSAGCSTGWPTRSCSTRPSSYYMSDHGLTLGEHGILGKHAARAQWHIYHVPAMIRHPEGKLAGRAQRLLRLHPRRPAHAALVHGRAGARGDERRGPLGAVRRQAAAAATRTSRPATRTTCSRATATGS